MLNLNVMAAFRMAREVARGLIAHTQPDSIINVSSQMGRVGAVNTTVYCASKHASKGMTKALTREFSPHNIWVKKLCPTLTQTPLTAPMPTKPIFRNRIIGNRALNHVGREDEVKAGPVVFFVSKTSAFMTESSLLIDGGWTAR